MSRKYLFIIIVFGAISLPFFLSESASAIPPNNNNCIDDSDCYYPNQTCVEQQHCHTSGQCHLAPWQAHPCPTPSSTPAPAVCDDGEDNDGDGKRDYLGSGGYPADPGCSSYNDGDEYNDGATDAWVNIYVTANIPTVTWTLECPGGSYSCNGTTGVGTQSPMDETWSPPPGCANNSCAGQGWYRVIPNSPSGYSCEGSEDSRGPGPPGGPPGDDIILSIYCESTGSPTPTPLPTVDLTCSQDGGSTFIQGPCNASLSTVQWMTTNIYNVTAATCTANASPQPSAWQGQLKYPPLWFGVNGIDAIAAGTSKMYTMTCTNPGGTANDSVTVQNSGGSLTVTSSPVGSSWSIDNGVGGGSGIWALYSGLDFNITYAITVIDPPQYDCVSDFPSHTLSAGSPNATFAITCTFNPADITPPTTTLTNITTPRNTDLVTFSGTASDNVSVAANGVTTVIRDTTAVPMVDWNPINGTWVPPGWVINTAMVPDGGASLDWSYNAVKPTLTTCHNYRVYVNAVDTAANTSGWNTTQYVLYDNTPPTGTITSIPSPTDTRLTSAGQLNGTIAGTATDGCTNVTAPLTLAIREWNGIGAEGACDNNNRDWNGSGWQGACTIGLTPSSSGLPAASVNWTYSSTPTTAQMTLGRRYHIYLQIQDGAGNLSNWSPNVSILYELPNVAPITSQVKATEPDYCSAGPSVTASWRYADPEDTPQSAFQVQVDNDAGFGSPNFDSGKLPGDTTSYYVSSGLTWNTVYQIRVQTWDAEDMASGWTNQTLCTGPGCIGGTSWRTPSIPYPIAAFTNVPTKPIAGEPAQFTDASSCYGLGICSQWAWDFGDGTTDTVQNPSHTFEGQGAYAVKLSVTDPWNQACSITKNLQVNKAIPFWKEVLPW